MKIPFQKIVNIQASTTNICTHEAMDLEGGDRGFLPHLFGGKPGICYHWGTADVVAGKWMLPELLQDFSVSRNLNRESHKPCTVINPELRCRGHSVLP